MARRSFSRDFRDLHGERWPPRSRRVHVIDEHGEVLATRLEKEVFAVERAAENPTAGLDPIARAIMVFGLLGVGVFLILACIVLALVAFVVLGAIFSVL